jgi:dTDP-4-amino-4,6-dideoxygalactose transaminase
MTDRPPMIPVARPWMDAREEEAVARVLRSGWISQGPEVEAFEAEFASALGAAHACAVTSATTALHLALQAAGVGPGDEVVTTSYTFVAPVAAILHCGATPVFADIDAATFNIDPARALGALTERTRAILAIHQYGLPCDVRALADLARDRSIALIEDAACAVGSEILVDGARQRIGRPHGDAACFSFHPRKPLTTGEGGMVVTRRPDWDARFRRLRHHGMSVSDLARHKAEDVEFESYDSLGYNYRMTDIQAAIGRVQLSRLAEILDRRRTLAARYDRMLAAVSGVVAPVEPEWARGNRQSYVVRLPYGRNLRSIMQEMRERGVATARGATCVHLEGLMRDNPWRAAPGGLNETERAGRDALALPLFPTLTEVEQDRVVEVLAAACR